MALDCDFYAHLAFLQPEKCCIGAKVGFSDNSSFTHNSIFRPDAFIKKNMHFDINDILTLDKCLWLKY